MKTSKRIAEIKSIIQTKKLSTHQEVLDALLEKGHKTNQAAVSRDFHKLGIVKIDGFYHIPRTVLNSKVGKRLLDHQFAGDNLIVLKTATGLATAIGYELDQLEVPSIVGTIAGDDTIFIAVKNKATQKKALADITSRITD